MVASRFVSSAQDQTSDIGLLFGGRRSAIWEITFRSA